MSCLPFDVRSLKKDYPDQAQDLARFTSGTMTPLPAAEAARIPAVTGDDAVVEVQRLSAIIAKQSLENDLLRVRAPRYCRTCPFTTTCGDSGA